MKRVTFYTVRVFQKQKNKIRGIVMKNLAFVLVILLIGILAFSPVEANHKDGPDKGGGKPPSIDISIVEAAPHSFGSQLNFAVTGGEDGMWVRNECSQIGSFKPGDLVYAQFNRVEGGVAGPFTLGPTPSWVGGGADCRAFVLTKFLVRIKKSAIFYEVVP